MGLWLFVTKTSKSIQTDHITPNDTDPNDNTHKDNTFKDNTQIDNIAVQSQVLDVTLHLTNRQAGLEVQQNRYTIKIK